MMSRSKLSYRQTLYTSRPNVFFLSRHVNRSDMQLVGIMFVVFDQESYRAVLGVYKSRSAQIICPYIALIHRCSKRFTM